MPKDRKKDRRDYGPPKKVAAFAGYQIYADYDGNAPDTAGMLFCSTEELAREVCEILNENPRKWGNLAYVEGCEHAKRFRHTECFLTDQAAFKRTVKAVFENVEGEDD